jgi:hypothetical protein
LLPGATLGSTFTLTLTNSQALTAEYLNPLNHFAQAEGPFPIRSAEFTVTAPVAGQSYAAWAASVFTPQQLADPSISDPGADPDTDTLINLGEYAHNLNPLLSDRYSVTVDSGIPTGILDGDRLGITFVRRKTPVDLVYQLDYGADLQSWADALAPPAFLIMESQVDVNGAGTLERVTYRTAQPAAGAPPRFVRVRVRMPP